MNKQNPGDDELLEAIRDLARIQLALNREFKSKSEIIRKLNSLSIPPNRIALLLGMNYNVVTSIISKSKKSPNVEKL